MAELRAVAGGVTRALFARTAGALAPADVDVLITACSSFSPIPSTASVLMAEIGGFRPDCEAYHLGGQACAAGPLAAALAGDVLAGLRARGRRPGGGQGGCFGACFRLGSGGGGTGGRRRAPPRSLNALVVVYENLTAGMYVGSDPAMLATTGLIRSGGAALWVADRAVAGGGSASGVRAKYRLAATGRFHAGARDPASLGAIGQRTDGDGVVGSYFTPAIPKAAAEAVEGALRAVATAGLRPGQLARAFLEGRRAARSKGAGAAATPPLDEKKPTPPVWATPAGRIDHFALHPGIHAMLRGFVASLGVPPPRALPAFAALRDYGNTSAPSTLYVLAYIESLVGVRKGQRILQLGVGAGMKAGANVWVAQRAVGGVVAGAPCHHAAWAHLGGTPVADADLPIPMAGRAKKEGQVQDGRDLMEGATGLVEGLVG